jgi:subtilisin-like proprotein convertase family protein/subtilisin family serine protease
MRNALIVLTLLLLAPVGTSFAKVPDEDVGAFEKEEVMLTYSRAVQLAFARVSDIDNYDSAELSETHSWLVVTGIPKEEHVETLGSPDETEEAPVLRGAYIWTYTNPKGALESLRASLDAGEIESFSPLLEKLQSPRFAPNDPEFDEQWHLNNSGQTSGGVVGEDANVTGVWEKYNGNGVVISVVDDGLKWNHSDIQPHYSSAHSYDWCNDDGDPSPWGFNGHGTSVAGVAGAVGNNSIYVAGAAFGATIAGSTLIACGLDDSLESDALGYHNEDIDIYTNSWGPYDDGMTLEAPGPLTIATIEDSVYNGRSGLGNIYTWAAGNGLMAEDNSNYDGYANNRFAIAVTAITHMGQQSWYAEPGANILVASHSDGDGEGITTTDMSGGTTDGFGGTSSATPLVAGIIALMLEANQNLTWRDVQHILVRSARMMDVNDSSWEMNGAGNMVSHKYGFGAADAGAAVLLAENWTSSGQESNASFGPFVESAEIPDGLDDWTEFDVEIPVNLQLESIDIVVDISHPNRGDLDIVLRSPSGKESWLAEEHSDPSNDYSNWMFGTVHHWDEPSIGNWTLKIRDSVGSNSGTLNFWEMIIHGVGNISDFDSDGWPDYNDEDDDNDGWSDLDEESCGTDPFDSGSLPSDNDLDGICDEVDEDDDDDGFEDTEEIACDTDPLNASSSPIDSDSDGTCDFVDEDDDNDGLSDYNETEVHGTDPFNNDTDGDGLSDYDEIVTYGTKADQADTDQDGLSDYDEVITHGTDPLSSDSDGDGLSDPDELQIWFSDPLTFDPDSDLDSYYHFQDCDDDNPAVFPGSTELLNGIDDDCDGLSDEGFNDTDADEDGLSDWSEYHVHGTNSTNADTDGDNLNDSLEIGTLGTDPLSADADTDLDGYYWFEDCDDENPNRAPNLPESLDGIDNDCDNLVDEDFWSIDSDLDGLTDYEEFHNYSTSPYDGDSDDDGLPDGIEVNDFDSDPLGSDADLDADGWYDFQDCDDDDFERAPDKPESLDGKDNDCDDEIDEDFRDLDSDGDLISDYDEYHNHSTNPELMDSDQDGLDDGTELLVKMSDPLSFDYDRDQDGFHEFEDCDDHTGSTNPEANELWNGMDDDCDELVDEDLDRLSILRTSPPFAEGVVWDSANESLEITISGISGNVDKSITWMFEDYSLASNVSSDGMRLFLPPIDCNQPITDLEVQLCSEGNSQQTVTARISDSGEDTEIVWEITVRVWFEPSTSSGGLVGSLFQAAGVVGLVILVVGITAGGAIAGRMVAHNKKLQDAFEAYGVTPDRLAVSPENRGLNLPSAPEIPGISSDDGVDEG